MVVMKSRTLYVNLRGATDLNDIRHLSNMKVYVVASISEGASNSQAEQKTAVDKNGNMNPTWNCPMQFTINESAAEQTLAFQLWCRRTRGDKIIGDVRVPIRELLAIMGEENDSVTEVSCPVTSTSGELQGKLIFLYSFLQITNPPPPPPPPPQQSYIRKIISGIDVNVVVQNVVSAVLSSEN